MKQSKTPFPKGLDAESALAALLRAAKHAHFIAHQNGTGVVIHRNGGPVIAPPDPAMYGELQAAVDKRAAEVVANYKKAMKAQR